MTFPCAACTYIIWTACLLIAHEQPVHTRPHRHGKGLSVRFPGQATHAHIVLGWVLALGEDAVGLDARRLVFKHTPHAQRPVTAR